MNGDDSDPGWSLLGDRGVIDAATLLWPEVSTQRRRELTARAAWTVIVEPSDGVAGRLTQALGPIEALRAVVASHRKRSSGGGEAGIASMPCGSPPEEAAVAGLDARSWSRAVARWASRLPPMLTEEALMAARRKGLRLVVPGDDDWPGRIGDLGDHAPIALWVRGDPAVLTRLDRAASLVGARAASTYGEHLAAELAGELAAAGSVIVSGGAYGIDGAAHRAAIRSGGETIAVMAGGADRVYPSGHANLLQRITAHGAVISEIAPGGAPTRFRFLKRNRLIASLGSATIVVEAAARSGSLSTAGAAAELGRPLGAVPGSVLAATSAGCHRLLREYDAICVTCAADARELVGLESVSGPPVSGSSPAAHQAGEDNGRGPDHREARVRDALAVGAWRTVDELTRHSGLSFEETSAAVGMLVLSGAAERDGDGYRLAKR